MAQTISAERLTLYDLEQQFALQQVTDPDFFLRVAKGLT